jgi:hypothetical protein
VTPETYVRACELDDDLPLDVCPGCGRDLNDMPYGADHMTPAQWERHAGLYVNKRGNAAGNRMNTPWASPGTTTPSNRCVWTADMLVARSWRRKWRAEYEEAHG